MARHTLCVTSVEAQALRLTVKRVTLLRTLRGSSQSMGKRCIGNRRLVSFAGEEGGSADGNLGIQGRRITGGETGQEQRRERQARAGSGKPTEKGSQEGMEVVKGFRCCRDLKERSGGFG